MHECNLHRAVTPRMSYLRTNHMKILEKKLSNIPFKLKKRKKNLPDRNRAGDLSVKQPFQLFQAEISQLQPNVIANYTTGS